MNSELRSKCHYCGEGNRHIVLSTTESGKVACNSCDQHYWVELKNDEAPYPYININDDGGYYDPLSGCASCGTDCVGSYCSSCEYQAMVDKFS